MSTQNRRPGPPAGVRDQQPQDSAAPAPRGGLRQGEMKVYGRNACMALFERRAGDIVRAYLTEDRLREFGALMRWCAANRKAYHVTAAEDLERVAASVHHEGVVLVARARPRLTLKDVGPRLRAQTGALPLIGLDGVGNPHNVGAIARLAAHFGVPMLLGAGRGLPPVSPSMMRMAEGGLEHVELVDVSAWQEALAALKAAGFTVIATSGRGAKKLYDTPLPARCVFLLGNEIAGVSDALAAKADLTLAIPGTGAVESLNVAQAAAVLLGEFWRQHPPA